MNLRDHKLYQFRVEYDYQQRVHTRIDDSVLVPARHAADFNVVAADGRTADLIVELKHTGRTNLIVTRLGSIDIHAAEFRQTYL